MIEPGELVTAVVWGGAVGSLMVVGAGLRRIPWRHAAVLGIGYAIVFAALKAAMDGVVDAGMLVLVGALGGMLVMRGWERGELERKRISAAITSVRAAPQG